MSVLTTHEFKIRRHFLIVCFICLLDHLLHVSREYYNKKLERKSFSCRPHHYLVHCFRLSSATLVTSATLFDPRIQVRPVAHEQLCRLQMTLPSSTWRGVQP